MTTNNHPANGPVSLERLYQMRQCIERNNQYLNGGNLAYTLTDMLKVIDEVLEARNAEPVAWRWFHLNQWHVTNDEERARDLAWDGVKVIPLYTAPPAPIAMKDHQIRELVNDLRDIAIEYHGAQQLRERIARTVRAAMLQAGNSPATPDGWRVEAERLAEMHGCSFVVFRNGEEPQCADPTKVIISFTDKGLGHHSSAPQSEVKCG